MSAVVYVFTCLAIPVKSNVLFTVAAIFHNSFFVVLCCSLKLYYFVQIKFLVIIKYCLLTTEKHSAEKKQYFYNSFVTQILYFSLNTNPQNIICSFIHYTICKPAEWVPKIVLSLNSQKQPQLSIPGSQLVLWGAEPMQQM